MAFAIPKIVYNGNTITFDFPPVEKGGPQIIQNGSATTSLSGVRQVSTNYIEEVRVLSFDFMSQSIFNQFDTFVRTWAALGKPFDYYEDKTSGSSISYEMSDLKAKPIKIAPKNATDYVWSYPFTMRRAL